MADKNKWLITKEELREACKTIRFLDVPPFLFTSVPESNPVKHLTDKSNKCPFCELEKKRDGK